MEDPTHLLDTLISSAGSLPARGGGIIREVSETLLPAYRKAWLEPTRHALFRTARDATEALAVSLREHNLYPRLIPRQEDILRTPSILPRPDTLLRDFENMTPFCRENRLGSGEAPLMFFLLLLCRNLCQSLPKWYDPKLPKSIGKVLSQEPINHGSPPPPPFSEELLSRYRTIRLLHVMNKLALLEESSSSELDRDDWQELTEVFQGGSVAIDAETVPHLLRPAVDLVTAVFAFRAGVEADIRQPAEADGVRVKESFRRLRACLRAMTEHAGISPKRKERLMRFGVAALVRCMPYVDSMRGRRIYSYLREGKDFPGLHHSNMFQFMPKKSDRLRLVNFLFAHGKGKPVKFFVDRFEGFFNGDSLCLENPTDGFSLQVTDDIGAHPTRLGRAWRRVGTWLNSQKSS